jgi:hypothetical protein
MALISLTFHQSVMGVVPLSPKTMLFSAKQGVLSFFDTMKSVMSLLLSVQQPLPPLQSKMNH